jgi:IclR family pca regulon transcriptional regulator
MKQRPNAIISENDKYFSKTIEKGLTILSLFDRDHSKRSLSEISRLTGINKTSVYRFVNTLVELGYLRKNSSNRLIRLGPRAFVLGHNFFHGFDLLQGFKPIIDRTSMQHSVSIDSALRHGRTLISLYRRELPNLIYFRLPLVMEDLHARALGKAILANLEEKELAGILKSLRLNRLTPKTITRKEDLQRELKVTKSRGYSINNEEYLSGLICIGAPLVNFNTKTVAGAVSLDFAASEFPLDLIEKNYTGILTKLASELSGIITTADV